MRRTAVIGAGWAGLSAAVTACLAGHRVHLFEMAPQAGGRARSHDLDAGRLDNGQHILIGAYRDTLCLLRQVGVDVDTALHRSPLSLRYPDGTGLTLPGGPPTLAFVRGVLGVAHWSLGERLALLRAAVRWRLQGFRCTPALTVSALCSSLPSAVIRDLVDPLCVAALNTPMSDASAQTFLRVLQDALFAGPGSADLLLPKRPLSDLLAEPALRWLTAHGATLHQGHRVMTLMPSARLPSAEAGMSALEATRGTDSWQVDGAPFDGVVVAATAREASRLVADIDPAWSQVAGALEYQPIVTVWVSGLSGGWPFPMVALRAGPDAPAQFAFDLGSLGGPPGVTAFVISGAATWVARGLQATASAVLTQAAEAFARAAPAEPPTVVHVDAERRATFACVPGLSRPAGTIAPGLVAAGDYIDGPYPATLEGAVRSGREAIDRLL